MPIENSSNIYRVHRALYQSTVQIHKPSRSTNGFSVIKIKITFISPTKPYNENVLVSIWLNTKLQPINKFLTVTGSTFFSSSHSSSNTLLLFIHKILAFLLLLLLLLWQIIKHYDVWPLEAKKKRWRNLFALVAWLKLS